MVKRIFLFIATNILVLLTISIAWQIISSFLNLDPAVMGMYPVLMVWALVWGMGGAFISLWLSKFMAKLFMRVQIIDPNTTDSNLRTLIEMVHNLSRAARLPKMPEVGIYESPEVNAFATGPSKNNALVAVSTGLLQRMNREQVEGVIGHEIAHVANGDMVTMTLIQGIVNAFVLFFSRIVASIVGSQVESKNRYIVEFALSIVLQIIFGILGALIVNYFSRQREFRADLGSAKTAGREKMISALRALGSTTDLINTEEKAFSSLKISGRQNWTALLSTHPSLEERIERLQKANVM